jgi:hypothetical protein
MLRSECAEQRSLMAIGMLLVILGCSEATGREACRRTSALVLDCGSCLVFEDGRER